MNKYKYAIEIGGSYTRIYVKDNGFALCEPTLVAAEPSPQGYQIIGLGQEAKKMMGRTNDSVEVFSPVSNGQINNYEYLKALLEYFFAKLDFKKKRDSIMVLVNWLKKIGMISQHCCMKLDLEKLYLFQL